MKPGVALVFSLAALMCSGAASASAPSRTSIDFATAPQAPALAFSWLKHLPPGAPPIVLTAPGHRVTDVQFDGRDHILYVAPAKGGGFCKSLTGPYGGSSCSGGDQQQAPPLIGGGATWDQSGPILWDGTLSSRDATRLEVSYQRGSTSEIPFAWVSKPISAGFFVFRVPTSHRRQGNRPMLISVYNKTGRLLAQTKIKTTGP